MERGWVLAAVCPQRWGGGDLPGLGRSWWGSSEGKAKPVGLPTQPPTLVSSSCLGSLVVG